MTPNFDLRAHNKFCQSLTLEPCYFEPYFYAHIFTHTFLRHIYVQYGGISKRNHIQFQNNPYRNCYSKCSIVCGAISRKNNLTFESIHLEIITANLMENMVRFQEETNLCFGAILSNIMAIVIIVIINMAQFQ